MVEWSLIEFSYPNIKYYSPKVTLVWKTHIFVERISFLFLLRSWHFGDGTFLISLSIFHITGCSPHPSVIRLSLPLLLYLTFIISTSSIQMQSADILCVTGRKTNLQTNEYVPALTFFCTILKKTIPENTHSSIFCKGTVIMWVSTVGMAAAELLNPIRPVIPIRKVLLRISAFVCWGAQLLPFHCVDYISFAPNG